MVYPVYPEYNIHNPNQKRNFSGVGLTRALKIAFVHKNLCENTGAV